MFNFLKKLMFWKKDEDLAYPPNFWIVDWTDVAREKGIKDDFNKEIKIYKNGSLKEIIKFSEEEIKSLEEVEELPGIDLTKSEDNEEFEFEQISQFGSIEGRAI